MLLRIFSLIVLCLLFVTSEECYAEKEYKDTVLGCWVRQYPASPSYIKIKDENVTDWYDWKHYEIASEEISDEVWPRLWDCDCEKDLICRITFIYTTDINDFDDKNSKGLVRKFTSIKNK